MKRNIVLAGAILLALAALAAAADLTGKWQGSFTFQDQAVPLTLQMKGADTITGTIDGFPSGTTEIKDGKLDGDTLTFYVNIEYQGSPVKLVFKGKVAESEIKFTFGTEGGEFSTDLVAKKG